MVPRYSRTSDWPRIIADEVNRNTSRVSALESATFYTLATVTFTPQTAPTTPVAGMTYFDSGTSKLRTWDGAAWQNHW